MSKRGIQPPGDGELHGEAGIVEAVNAYLPVIFGALVFGRRTPTAHATPLPRAIPYKIRRNRAFPSYQQLSGGSMLHSNQCAANIEKSLRSVLQSSFRSPSTGPVQSGPVIVSV